MRLLHAETTSPSTPACRVSALPAGSSCNPRQHRPKSALAPRDPGCGHWSPATSVSGRRWRVSSSQPARPLSPVTFPRTTVATRTAEHTLQRKAGVGGRTEQLSPGGRGDSGGASGCPERARVLLILSGFPSTSRYTPCTPFRQSDKHVFPYRIPRRCLPILINSLSTKFDAKTDCEVRDLARKGAFHCN